MEVKPYHDKKIISKLCNYNGLTISKKTRRAHSQIIIKWLLKCEKTKNERKIWLEGVDMHLLKRGLYLKNLQITTRIVATNIQKMVNNAEIDITASQIPVQIIIN